MRGCERGAKQAYERALDRDASLAEPALRLAYLAIHQSRTSPLKKDDERLVALSKGHLDTRVTFLATMFLGIGAEKRGDLPGSQSRYEAARALAPAWPSARYALSAVLVQQGRTESARDLLGSEGRQDAGDPWYGYSCTLMTSEALEKLQEWTGRQGPER